MNILLKIMEFLIFHVTQEFNIAKNVKIDIVAKCAKQLIISLEGGAKGKKKKAATKKVKKKHVHKKEKLRILKCYKVDGEKVVRLRRMCEVCPPGTFLAEHADRLYCGRCRSTYTKLVDKEKQQKQQKKKQPKAEKPKVEETKEAPKKGKKKK